ncbi:hypothetical protein MYX77_14715, partial [Acidobacteriia bacterium AH_259_A11_L15]|nr:hypothetical protein [Acidobacteriia bacterium AH_259_A11_L15]
PPGCPHAPNPPPDRGVCSRQGGLCPSQTKEAIMHVVRVENGTLVVTYRCLTRLTAPLSRLTIPA